MANKKSWIKLDKIKIIDGITVRIPTVGEILDDEQTYYSVTTSLTSAPFTYMVQLDDMGIDYTTIDDFALFRMLFCSYSNQIVSYTKDIYEIYKLIKDLPEDSDDYKNGLSAISLLKEKIKEVGIDTVFEDLVMACECDGEIVGFYEYEDTQTHEIYLLNPATGVKIDRLVHMDLANAIRKINLYEKVNSKPGNESAKKYFLERERKKQKRNAKKPYQPYLENMVFGLVNTAEFPYNFEECMELSIYNFNNSFRQVQHKINFDKTMIGVYAGTVNVSSMTNKELLSWLHQEETK